MKLKKKQQMLGTKSIHIFNTNLLKLLSKLVAAIALNYKFLLSESDIMMITDAGRSIYEYKY